ncbi:MAG: DNA mismatch repair protein MutS [Desulfovibrio sp.]|nr:DNA mismatch repair protein MutS [Desulfovibrio sp.]
MFEQYMRIKADHPDALLFYRMGDFYELFFDDAKTASRELQLTLTSRNKSAGNDIPMCGVPWHSSRSYIAQLIDKGYVVAICDQIEDPKEAKGLVKRAVTQVITPGTILDLDNLDQSSHNYLGAVGWNQETAFGFVWADISTGSWTGAEFHKEEDLWQWVLKMKPKELLLPRDLSVPPYAVLSHIHKVPQAAPIPLSRAEESVCRAQKVRSASALGLDTKPLLCLACAHLLTYLEQTQPTAVEKLEPFTPLNLGHRMLIDDTTERNLELFTRQNGQKGKGTLRHVLQHTLTPMGGRRLEDMLHHPFRDLQPILETEANVAFFAANDRLRHDLREQLEHIYDLERLTQRVVLNRTSPKDMAAIAASLSALPAIHALLQEQSGQEAPFATLLERFDQLSDVREHLEKALVDDPPQLITEGGLFRSGFNEELDRLLDMVTHAEEKLAALLEKERTQSGIAKLKLGFNRVFGYYYEVSRSHAEHIPDYFERRQSLANAERFTTKELKELEEQLLSASDNRKTLEYNLFLALREDISGERERLLSQASLLGELDYWLCLANVARENGWTMPTFINHPELRLQAARHPVVESIIGSANYMPNDINLGQTRSFCLLTGPNMSGKSTVLRQVAIIAILAQMGSMVPADHAELGLVDKLFSRVGASDNLAQGESTFMVEMMETARILRQATKNSLIILDEIGRGTSTYDGVALAWAIVEYIVKRFSGKTRTLFATHYHELTELEGRLPVVFTMNVAIKEYNGDIVFLHKLIPGPADKSYGVDVAKLAGIPREVVNRAKELLLRLESGRKGMQQSVRQAAQVLLPGLVPEQKNDAAGEKTSEAPHPLLTALRALDPDRLSPMEALQLLTDWKRRFGEESADKRGEL